MSGLYRKLLVDPMNRWVFSNAGTGTYLVGGYLRDHLLSRTARDADYVVSGDPERLARQASHIFNGSLVILKRNSTYRVVLDSGKTLDFSRLRGTISNDLSKRDFTINAMAWGPDRQVIDPFGGLDDLRAGVIRVVNKSNISDDPVRVLRAYRHAVQLGFMIHSQTRKVLRGQAGRLLQSAPERISDELFQILNQLEAGTALKLSLDDAVLHELLHINRARLIENIQLLNRFRNMLLHKSIGPINKNISNINKGLYQELSQGLSRAGLIRLMLLFYQSEDRLFTNKNLRFSSLIYKAVRSISRAINKLPSRITINNLFEMYMAASGFTVESAFALSSIMPRFYTKFLSYAILYQKIDKRSLITGKEIQTILGLNPGVYIGQILTDLKKMRFLQKVNTKSEARRWLLTNFT